MLRNYLITAIRSAQRNKGVTAINVIGLALSMAVCMLIAQIVRVQASFDEFHSHADRTYRVYSRFKSSSNADASHYGTSPAMLAQVLEEEVPGVEEAIHVYANFRGMAAVGDEVIPISGSYADPEFFDVFSFALAAGDPATALRDPGKVVLSAAAARRLFGWRPALGEVLRFEHHGDMEVSGVLADGPYRTFVPIEAIASMATVRASRPRLFEAWKHGINRSYTFVRLAEDADPDVVQTEIDELTARRFLEDNGDILHNLNLELIGDMNLTATMKGNELAPAGSQLGTALSAQVAWFMAALGGVVLAMAGFNYWSLTVARALRRSKEVGVRKTTGATRAALMAQFMVEAIVNVFVSAVIALGLFNLLVTEFNNLHMAGVAGLGIAADVWREPELYLSIAAVVGLVAVAAGSYPAVHLSRFQAAAMVEGGLRWRVGGIGLRRLLTVAQFAVSLLLIVFTTTVSEQIQYLIEIDYGLRREGIITVNLHDVGYDLFRRDALAVAGVDRVAGTQVLPAMGSREDNWMAQVGGDVFKGYKYRVDEEFIPVFGLELLAGRNFEAGRDETRSIIVNEIALARYGFANPGDAIGQIVRRGGDKLDDNVVIGVVRDFQSNTVGMAPTPVFLAREGVLRFACVMTQPGQTAAVRERLHKVWKGYGLMMPFEGEPYDEQIANQEFILLIKDVLGIIRIVALLAVTIACLGLLGIAAYAAESRVKEVGVRKTIGATAQNLVLLLSSEQAALVVIASVVAIPTAVFVNQSWLEMFGQRVEIGAALVAGPAAMLVAIALLTVASQTVRAALANPVDSLRYE